MFSYIIITILLILFISYKFNKIYENNIINIVISKLEIIPKHYKIIRKKNIIIIKCHHYSNNLYCSIKTNDIKISKNFNGTNYTLEYKTLDNYDTNKNISIVIFDIIIDLTNKKYTIITSYFTIINCKYDLDNLYSKLIDKLNSKSYYIEINNLYDNNLNFNSYIDERNFEPIANNTTIINFSPYKKTEKSFKMYDCINQSISIIIKNDNNNDNMIINSMFRYSENINYPAHRNYEISNTIDTKPHIYNNDDSIRIYKINGYFI